MKITDITDDLELYLPWPPSVNSYYSHTRNGVFIGPKGKMYRRLVDEAVQEQAADLELTDRLMVEVILFPPDKRVRDLDNHMKGLLDACTHSGIWQDDRQIDQLHIYRGEICKGGMVEVRITEAIELMPNPNL